MLALKVEERQPVKNVQLLEIKKVRNAALLKTSFQPTEAHFRFLTSRTMITN